MHSVRTVTAGTTMSKFRERLRNGHFGSPFESAAWLLLLELYAALRPIDAITGATTADDILNRIFSTFCIGK